MKRTSIKILTLLSVIVILSVALTLNPVGAVTSPAFSNWYWTSDTNASAVVVADANNDHVNDVVVAGYYNDGSGWSSQIHVLNSATYAVENVGSWTWGSNSQINAIAVGDVNGDGLNETVTGGAYFDGTHWNAIVSVQSVPITSGSMTTLNIGAWLRGTSSVVTGITIGDVNGDGLNEIVAVGSYNDGTGWNSEVDVITPSLTSTALNMRTLANWKWGIGSTINSVAIGDINGDGLNEIVTGGSYNDGTRASSLLHVLICAPDFSSLRVLNYGSWYWTGDTSINSVAVANLTGTTGLSIIAGGQFFDGTRINSVVHILNATLTSPFFTVQQATYWVWTGTTKVTSVAVGNFTGQPTLDIVTGGYYFDGQRNVAQVMVLDSSNLAQRVVSNWFTTSNTQISCVAVGLTPLGTRVFGAGQFYDGIRAEAQLTVWA